MKTMLDRNNTCELFLLEQTRVGVCLLGMCLREDEFIDLFARMSIIPRTSNEGKRIHLTILSLTCFTKEHFSLHIKEGAAKVLFHRNSHQSLRPRLFLLMRRLANYRLTIFGAQVT